jgi:hypothetical protein
LKDAGKGRKPRQVLERIAVGCVGPAYGEIQSPIGGIGEVNGIVAVSARIISIMKIVFLQDDSDCAGAIVADLHRILIDERELTTGNENLATAGRTEMGTKETVGARRGRGHDNIVNRERSEIGTGIVKQDSICLRCLPIDDPAIVIKGVNAGNVFRSPTVRGTKPVAAHCGGSRAGRIKINRREDDIAAPGTLNQIEGAVADIHLPKRDIGSIRKQHAYSSGPIDGAARAVTVEQASRWINSAAALPAAGRAIAGNRERPSRAVENDAIRRAI